MSARERLQQFKKDREERLRRVDQTSSSPDKGVEKLPNKKIKKTLTSSKSTGGNKKSFDLTPSPVYIPPPRLSVRDLETNTTQYNSDSNQEADRVLSSYWEKYTEGFLNCNSYTNIVYDDVDGCSPGPSLRQISPGLNRCSTTSKQTLAQLRKQSEAVLRSSLGTSVELSIQRLNASDGIISDELGERINYNFRNDRNGQIGSAGFDQDGLLEPDDDTSTNLSMQQMQHCQQ